MPVTVRALSRVEVEARFDELAALRIAVFRDWPYLYDGDRDYERRYLATYLESPGAVVIGALDGDNLVGAATASPLREHDAAFAAPFRAAGLDPDAWFYFGESVLLPAYRGQGVGVRFFEEREFAARGQGFANCAFCAVIRPPDHPARPAAYRPLDAFWANRGYGRLPGLTTRFAWRDLGDVSETEKPMEFWGRTLHR